MSPSRSHQAGDSSRWEIHRELLRSLWLEENRKLEHLMKFMADSHQFHAEKWEYEAKFREWNYRKKLRGVDWGIIGDIVGKRKREGKDSDVFYHGTHLPPKKVKKEIMRNRSHPSGNKDHELSYGVAIRSPKMISADYVAQNKRPSVGFSFRPLMPKQEPSSGHIDLTPWTLAHSSSNLGLGASQGDWSVPRTRSSNDDLTLLNPTTWNTAASMLPFWATRDAFSLRGLPWFKFHASLYSFGDLTSSVQGVVEHLNGEQPDQQARFLTFDIAENFTDAITALKKQRGASFDLEEVMPEPFRTDVSNGSQVPTTVSKRSSTIQVASVGLFLAANNLLCGHELVAFIKQVFDAGHDHLFERLFRLRSPTIRAFSCRLLESISQEYSYEYGVTLLERLLRCGLDRTILTGPTGGRCLQLAIYRGNEALTLLLLRTEVQRNPKLGPKKPFNRTPVELAEKHNGQKVLRVLLGLAEPQQIEDEIALREACTDDDFEKIRSLLDGGVDVDCDRNLSGDETILEWTFFKRSQCYDILLPYSQFSKVFWTTSGILSAADAGREALQTYLACKRCPDEDNDGALLQHATFAGLKNGLIQEIHTILDEEWIVQLLDPDELLVAAARGRNIEILTKLVQLGADPRTLDAGEMNSLLEDAIIAGPNEGCLKEYLENGLFLWENAFVEFLWSVENGDSFTLATFKFLLDQSPDLNSIIRPKYLDKWYTPLQLTVFWGNTEMLEYTVDAGASLNEIAEGASRTALGEAVVGLRLDMVEFLLQEGADVKELADHRDATLLELLVGEGNREFEESEDITSMIRALLNAGADLNGPIRRNPSANWNTALTKAILNADFDDQIRPLLDLGADIHQIGGGKMARTPLQAAAESGQTDIVKELLERGARVNALAAPNHGRTALQAACGRGKGARELISLLLQAGADVSAPAAPSYGRTALQALCSSGAPSSEMMALLIEKGADINAPPANRGGITALQGAASMGNIKIVMLLIDQGAYVNAAPSASEGRMALDGAAEHGRLDTVQLLLTFGATCMVPGSTGYDSAIQFAEENGHFVIADLLRDYKG